MLSGAFRQVVCDMLQSGHTVRFQANGTSMVPTIADGETLIAEPIGADEARLGDVVLCDLGPRLVAHRIVGRRLAMVHERTPSVFHVRGDAAGAGMDRIEGRRIVGRIQWVERDGSLRAIRRTAPWRRMHPFELLRWGKRVWIAATP